MIRVTQLEQTCFACPSQWEGEAEDGRYVFIRYRFGYLSATVSNGLEDHGEYVFAQQVGDAFDGVMEYDELKVHLAGAMELP